MAYGGLFVMAKKKNNKKSYNVYHKGKKLTKFYTDYIEKVAEAKGVPVNTPKRLHDFYEKNKELFAKQFDRGLTSFKKGTQEIINDINTADSRGKTFILTTIGSGANDTGEPKEVTKNELIYNVVMTERYLNNLLDTTGFTISYTIGFDGTMSFTLPKREKEPEWADDEIENVSDLLLSEYNIVVYFSEPATKEDSERVEANKIKYALEIESKEHEIKQTRKKSGRRKK